MREIVIKTIFGDDKRVARLSPFFWGGILFSSNNKIGKWRGQKKIQFWPP
jgi:hypothetical protein